MISIYKEQLSMQIRHIRPEDRAEWVRMRELLWPGSPDEHESEAHTFLAQADDSSAVIVVDRLDGRLGGFIEMSQRNYAEGCASSPVAYIEGWFVDADLRRRGLGAALVRAGEQWARGRGLREIASDAELENEISITAHKAIGYEEEARIVCFRKELE
jgi:aminoglycoside 6'-N-acetyltransferase I